jgi:HEPN domain
VLLGLARDDEHAARALLPIEGVTDAILGFHAQQAVEKSLKAVLALRRVEFPYTHDLDGLLELCRKNGLDVPEALSDVDRRYLLLKPGAASQALVGTSWIDTSQPFNLPSSGFGRRAFGGRLLEDPR